MERICDSPAFTSLMLYKCDLHIVHGYHSLLNSYHLIGEEK